VRRNLALALLVLGTALVVGGSAFATATRYVPICPFRLSATTTAIGCPPSLMFNGDFKPKKLPKSEMAPVAVNIQGKISTADGTHPPALREVTIDFDKNGTVDVTGLPSCRRSQLERRGTKAARRICRQSIVGTGIAHVGIEASEQGPIPLPLTLFNGGVEGGTTTLFIHTSIPAPTPTPIVAAVKLRKHHGGRYGLRAVSTIPPIADGSGSVLDYSFTIERLFEHKGTRQRYAIARCFDDRLSARMRSVFSEGTEVVGTVVRACTPKADRSTKLRPEPGR
jgi:hypothetical protein